MKLDWRVAAAVWIAGCHSQSPTRHAVELREAPPNPDAGWPWAKAKSEAIFQGVRHWLVENASDGCSLDLIRFDFQENPRLRFEVYDQDQDDEKPFDNRALYGRRGVGEVVRSLDSKDGKKTIAACNGLFFAYTGTPGGHDSVGSHVGPVVLKGKAHYNVGNPRWTFGVLKGSGPPKFAALFKPDFKVLDKTFEFAAAGAQLLVKDGRPTRLAPLPKTVGELKKRPTDTENDAGGNGVADYIRTARTSLAWSRDSRHLYMLVVTEPDSELESSLSFKRGLDPGPGWTLKDLQFFWLSFGAWGAVNCDGGMLTQLYYMEHIVTSQASGEVRRGGLVPSATAFGPKGGSLMYFYVAEE